MRKTVVSKSIDSTCDKCGKNEHNPSGWISFEIYEDNGIRLVEKVRDIKGLEARHLVNRLTVDFCSIDCAKNYLSSAIDGFLFELNPITRPKNFKYY